MKVNNIDFIALFINKYILIDFFMSNKIDNKAITVCFIRYIHIVNDFKINLFLNNNILKLKNIVLYVNKKSLL